MSNIAKRKGKRSKTIDPEGRIRASNSYYSEDKMGFLRVYLDDVKIVEVAGNIWGLRTQCRKFPTSIYRKEFVEKCEDSVLTEEQMTHVMRWLLED